MRVSVSGSLSLISQVMNTAAGIGAVVLLAIVMVAGPVAHENAVPVAGWIERVVLFPGGLTLSAKLDTGAKTSSTNAADQM